ncbi:GAF domain-containing protein [Tropicimonas sediminicola]|uniref:Pyridoxamine 5'-phosphate oxidase n=1 Tax=Tropicimonas sediminicola TaxID=1031541 RepID=A0A239LBB2_9RHOB|nr:GAF domain-containing protein [Tropicimonas sediminicola]SNT27123.1 Pyridoxamine 5'-phosphate oxidase [Tropicimonas sediminicola]
MTGLRIDGLRRALEGVMASVLATCDADGIPNVSMISQVHYVDPEHVALSYQFFNKTRRNVMATRRAIVLVTDPETLEHFRLSLSYEETQIGGPLFEGMKAKLAGIASHHGVEDVFRLLGADIYRVQSIEAVPGPVVLPVANRPSLLAATRRTCSALDGCADLEELLDCVTACLERDFGISWSMVLMAGAEAGRLYTVASHGYPHTGVGAEVALGEGVIGVAARENAPIRIGHMTREYRYGAAISDAARRHGIVCDAPRLIAFPGLEAPRSQIALPITEGGVVVGVLFAEDDEINRFGYEEEDALALVAGHVGARMSLLRQDAADEVAGDATAPVAASGQVTLRYFRLDQSVFLENEYLIKGVAGAILWRLLCEHRATGRTEFTTRELRLDPALRLPAHAENLDARLILLRKRLEERSACLRIEKAGRGRFRLVAACRVALEEPDAGEVAV